AAFADFSENWHFTQERNVLPRGLGLTAAVTENFHALAVGRGEITHVFDKAENRHVDLLEHRDAFAHDAERRFLRRGHDKTAVQRHGLAQRELRVARARWQIHKQEIHLAPFHREQELLD